MRLADVNPSQKLLCEQIQGISGGGFFVVDDGDEYKLLGIETDLADMADTFNEVQGPTIDVFAMLVFCGTRDGMSLSENWNTMAIMPGLIQRYPKA